MRRRASERGNPLCAMPQAVWPYVFVKIEAFEMLHLVKMLHFSFYLKLRLSLI
jgi:hypothetical protein